MDTFTKVQRCPHRLLYVHRCRAFPQASRAHGKCDPCGEDHERDAPEQARPGAGLDAQPGLRLVQDRGRQERERQLQLQREGAVRGRGQGLQQQKVF